MNRGVDDVDPLNHRVNKFVNLEKLWFGDGAVLPQPVPVQFATAVEERPGKAADGELGGGGDGKEGAGPARGEEGEAGLAGEGYQCAWFELVQIESCSGGH